MSLFKEVAISYCNIHQATTDDGRSRAG